MAQRRNCFISELAVTFTAPVSTFNSNRGYEDGFLFTAYGRQKLNWHDYGDGYGDDDDV